MPDFFLSESDASLRVVRFTCVKNDDANDFLQSSDMSTFTVKLTKPGSTTPANLTGSPAPVQINSGTAKGLFEVTVPAADLNTVGVNTLTITNSGGTKTMKRRDIELYVKAASPWIATPPVNVTQWAGTAVATPTTAGVPRVDVKAMETGVLTATAIAADAITAAKIADAALDAASFTGAARTSLFGILDSGTAQVGSTSGTLKLQASASSSNFAYVGATVYLDTGTGLMQINSISSYNGTTKVATMASAWGVTPDATSTYVVVAGSAPSSAPSAGTVASAVWDLALEGSYTAGQIVRSIQAFVGNRSAGYNTGTLTFRSMDGTKVRATVLVDRTGRRAVVFNDLD